MNLRSRPKCDTENIQIFRFDYFLSFFSLLRHISALFIRSSSIFPAPSFGCRLAVGLYLCVRVCVLVAPLCTLMHQYIHWHIIIFVRSAHFILALCVETPELEKCRYLFINIFFSSSVAVRCWESSSGCLNIIQRVLPSSLELWGRSFSAFYCYKAEAAYRRQYI